MTITAADVLDQAAKELTERGWCQGDLENSEGNVCALGALTRAAQSLMGDKYYNLQNQAIERMAEFVLYQTLSDELKQAHAQNPYLSTSLLTPVALWNDKVAKSQEDVLLMFKHAREGLDH